MRTAMTLLMTGLTAWSVGCSVDSIPPAAQVAEITSPLPAASTSDEQSYREPAIPGGSGDLHQTRPLADGILPVASNGVWVGPFRMRSWPTHTVRFHHGGIRHMPRWFADPHDDVDTFGPACWGPQSPCVGIGGSFGWDGDDLVAFVYCPGRFLVNLVAVPVSIIVRPVWAPEVTDRTATVLQAEPPSPK